MKLTVKFYYYSHKKIYAGLNGAKRSKKPDQILCHTWMAEIFSANPPIFHIHVCLIDKMDIAKF
jgi:hypothetical protein